VAGEKGLLEIIAAPDAGMTTGAFDKIVASRSTRGHRRDAPRRPP
jgi:hypothetical protein